MKKLLSLILVLVMLVSMTACGGSAEASEAPAANDNAQAAPAESEEIKIALLICAGGDLDDRGFNTAAWKAINQYCDESNMKCGYYMPSESTVEMDMAACDAAVKAGAEVFLLGAKEQATGLAMESSKLENFSQAEYDALFQAMSENAGGVYDSIPNDRTHASPTDIPIQTITLDYIA